ncbi:MAG TPA: hypothetical protein ENN20_05250 [Candidatus Marinimicrobia bacterium]|nr:hypothetical protein [Candidatus Neomarinimicrobiota bacterium]
MKVYLLFSPISGESLHKKYLDKIINSNEFSGSKIYSSYLTYLLNATNQGKCLKEITIAMEFFDKDSSFNPAEDTTVRSHTYTLRKKLQNYYYNEGKDDKYRLKIPKGHYNTQFVTSAAGRSGSGKILRWSVKHYQLLIILVLIGCVAFLWIRNRTILNRLNKYQIVKETDSIWHDYLESDLPILIVAGDHFFFDDYSTDYNDMVSIRYGKINSPEDFEKLKSQFPGDHIRPTEEPYFPYHSIWSLPPILSMLNSVGQKPVMRRSSTIGPQILGEYNIIYLGSIKTLYILRHTLSKSHLSYEILPHKVIYTPKDSSESQVFRTSLHSVGPNEDLVIAVKLSGPTGNAIFMIASYHSLGAPEIVNYLINENTRLHVENTFMEKYGRMPQFFEILFRVTGIDKTAYNTEILVFNEIVEK